MLIADMEAKIDVIHTAAIEAKQVKETQTNSMNEKMQESAFLAGVKSERDKAETQDPIK